jgi:hypothetical protein
MLFYLVIENDDVRALFVEPFFVCGWVTYCAIPRTLIFPSDISQISRPKDGATTRLEACTDSLGIE